MLPELIRQFSAEVAPASALQECVKLLSTCEGASPVDAFLIEQTQDLLLQKIHQLYQVTSSTVSWPMLCSPLLGFLKLPEYSSKSEPSSSSLRFCCSRGFRPANSWLLPEVSLIISRIIRMLSFK